MNKKRIFDLLYVALIIGVLIFVIFAINFMLSNGKACMEDPLEFFEGLNEGAECYCIKDGIVFPETIRYDPNPDYRKPTLDDYFNTTEFNESAWGN